MLERGRSVIGLEGFYKLRCIGIADAVADLLDLHVRSRQEVGGAFHLEPAQDGRESKAGLIFYGCAEIRRAEIKFFRNRFERGGSEILADIAFYFDHALVERIVAAGKFDRILIILNKIGEEGCEKPLKHMVIMQLLFRLLREHIQKKLRQKCVLSAVEGQRVAIMLRIKRFRKICRERCAAAHEHGKNAVKGAFSDFYGQRYAVGLAPQIVQNVRRNDRYVPLLHIIFRSLDSVQALSLGCANDLKKIMPMRKNIDIARQVLDLRIRALFNEKLFIENAGQARVKAQDQILFVLRGGLRIQLRKIIWIGLLF